MVQELQNKWKQQMDPTMTDLQQWQQFKILYCTTIKEYDQMGLTTAKANRANSIVNQGAINLQHSLGMDNFREELDTLTHAMSVFTLPPPATNHGQVPPVIQTNSNSNTSALGTADQTHRLLMEERNRFDRMQNEQRNKFDSIQNELRVLKDSIAATATTMSSQRTPSTSTRSPNERIVHLDGNGNKWFKRAHYCSKHGYNVSHSNPSCRDRHKTEGQKWIDGATAQDNKGGSTRNADTYQQWFNPATRVHAKDLPP